MDRQFCAYIEDLWLSGEVKSPVHFFIMRRRIFPGAWSLYGAWERHEVPRRAAPLPIDVLFPFWGLAALLLLAFHCLLRTGEAVGMGGFSYLSAASLEWPRFRGPKVAPGMEHRKSSPLLTRWTMPSSSTFAMVWNPRIWFFAPRPGPAVVQSLPRRCHARLLPARKYAQNDPQGQVERFALCPHPHQRWPLHASPLGSFGARPGLEYRNIFADCLTHIVALALHPETVLPGWGTWKDPHV